MFYRTIPLSLTLSRIGLAPVLIGLAATNLPGWTLGTICVIAFLTDLFDGILARRWGVATPQLRRLDVNADVISYLAMLVAFYLRRPDVIHDYGWYFLGFLAAEAGCQAISFARFRQGTATHSYLNKFWAVVLCIVCPLILMGSDASVIMPITLMIGLAAYLEVILMLLLANDPPIDVPTLWHLLKRQRTAASQKEAR